MGSNWRCHNTDLIITSGPEFLLFINAAFKGGTGLMQFDATTHVKSWGVIRVYVDVMVTEVFTESGLLCAFKGTLGGRMVRGTYDADEGSEGYRTGRITFVS